MASVSNHEHVGNRRAGTARRRLLPTKIAFRVRGWFATSALSGRAGPVTFLLRQKGNPKRRPQGLACFLRCSQRAGRIATTGAIRSLVSQPTRRPSADCAGNLQVHAGLRPRAAPLLGASLWEPLRTNARSLRDVVHGNPDASIRATLPNFAGGSSPNSCLNATGSGRTAFIARSRVRWSMNGGSPEMNKK